MKSEPTLPARLIAPLLLVLPFAALAQSSDPIDPRISSWLVTPSRQYARIYENDAAKNAGTVLTTWSRGAGVQLSPTYAGVMQVSYSTDWVYLRSSGLGYHVMGPWYIDGGHTRDFPSFPGNADVLYRIPRRPSVPTTKTFTNRGSIGYFVDGVAMFDYTDTFSYSTSSGTDAQPNNGVRGDGIWNRDAYVNEKGSFDAANAHQASGNYHYHATTPALRHLLGDHVDYDSTTKTYVERTAAATSHSPIVAWASDGHPVYGPYGYASPQVTTSGVRRMISGYVMRDGANGTSNLATTGRTTLPAWAARAQNRAATLATTQYGPAVDTDRSGLGRYLEDYDYLGDLGQTQGTDFDLDVYNGRFCVTPEFPNGTYAYFLSVEPDGTPRFPYIIGRWFYGSPTGAFSLPAGSRDAAIVSILPTGSYTTPVGDGGSSGITLLEVYDADSSATPTAKLINASARAFVGTGESVLIPGFVISGTGAVRLLIRAAGPALTPLGVTDALADPQITLFSGSTAIATNDNWSSAANAAEIAATATSVGAFTFSAGSRDAALVVTLPAGSYTASISGGGNTTGTALMEIYVAP